jgi:4-amino-4-deoxy-L-arabinose transferase-like glycosyltransferase
MAFPAQRRDLLCWALIGLGAVLRLRVYFADRSLRRDEASLTYNLLTRSVAGLFGPLDREQGAPIGFLLLEKASIGLLGDGEMALRLIPLVAGLAVLPLLFLVARRLVSSDATTLALAIVAIGEPLVRYSAEVKQYSLDVAIALAILAVALRARDGNRLWTILLGVTGVLALWLSHPAVFVLGGVGASLAAGPVVGREWRRVGVLLLLALAWGLSFLCNDLFFLRHLRGNYRLLGFWTGSFAPFPPHNLSELRWYVTTLFDIFRDPVGLPASGLAVLAFFVGVVELWRKDSKGWGMLMAPVGLALMASALRKYPFAGRLILFTAPLLALVVAEGLSSIGRAPDRRGRWLAFGWSALLLFEPALGAFRDVVRPPEGEELRPILRAIQARVLDDDRIYVYHGAEPAYSYYATRSRDPIRLSGRLVRGVSGRDDWTAYPQDLEQLRDERRVWVIFSHVVKVSGVDEERFLLFFLDRMGTRRDEIRGFGASAYLYDLSRRGGSAMRVGP